MFIYFKEAKYKFSMYAFYPGKYGPYSSKIMDDLEYYCKKGYVEKTTTQKDKSTFRLSTAGLQYSNVDNHDKDFFKEILDKFQDTDDLVNYIHKKYPEYSIKSEWDMGGKTKVILDSEPKFFLIGYENRDIDDLMNELIQNNIDHLVDVRYNAKSMKFDYNKNRLEGFLSKVNIKYFHIPELGIDESSRKGLKNKEDFEGLFEAYRLKLKEKKQYLDQLIELHANNRTALLCYERDYNSCHRREVGKYLEKRGYIVEIIN